MTGTLHEDHYRFLFISRSVLLRMRNVSHKSCGENPNTHVMLNNFLRISCRLWDSVEEYRRNGQATYDGMAHAHCMPDNWLYKHMLRICNTYCFSTGTMVARTRLSVAFIRTLPVLFFCNDADSSVWRKIMMNYMNALNTAVMSTVFWRNIPLFLWNVIKPQ